MGHGTIEIMICTGATRMADMQKNRTKLRRKRLKVSSMISATPSGLSKGTLSDILPLLM